ncbi:hypothetical protein [Lysobacter terrae]
MLHATKQFVIYLDKDDAWRWVLYSDQSKRLDECHASFRDKRDCLKEVGVRSPGMPVYNCSEGRWEGELPGDGKYH